MKLRSARRMDLELLPRETELEALERRLEDGYRLIETALQAGEDVTDLETFWIALLKEYEARCDDLPLAA